MISIAHSPSQSKSTHLQMNIFCIVFICFTSFSSQFQLLGNFNESFLYGFGNKNIATVYKLTYDFQ